MKGQELEGALAAEQPPALIAEDHRRVDDLRALEQGNRAPSVPPGLMEYIRTVPTSLVSGMR